MGRPLRVLLVEDSDNDAALLLRELRKDGYEPEAQRVETAEAMRAALDAQPWEVIISDHAMPRFSALAALAIYHEYGLDLPFIIVSGAIGEAVAVEAMRSGAHDYVLKDNLARLTAAIDRELHEAVERRERRRAEAEAARAGREWSETFDAMPSAVCLLDLGFRILRANRPMARLAGQVTGELEGESFAALAWGSKKMPASLLAAQADEAVDLVFDRLAPGRTFEVRLHAIPDAAGAPRAYVQIARDVTEARQLQAQLLQSQKLAALGEVISGIAHELNNPLAAVVSHAQLLRRHNLSEEAEESARAVEESALRAARVVRSLLTFSRQQAPERVPVDVNQVVEETLALRAAPLRAEGIELEVNLARPLPPVLGDASQLQQVLLNLVNNAQRAMQKTPTRRLTLATEANGASLRVRVRDTGAGIPPEHLGRIFEPFFTTQEVGKGTGLGLSVCHGIVQDHGGALRVTSEVGVGTEFTLELPVTQETRRPAKVEHAPVALLEDTRVLVVEDEALIRIALLHMLNSMGVQTGAAPEGTAALEALEQQPYQAVICDLRMPGMDGRELYLTASARWPELAGRFIFCTGDTLNPDTVAFVEEHGLRLLAKPFVTESVRRVLAEVVGSGA